MKQTKVKYSIWFLILFYAVGITGFVVPQTHSFFKTLTPFALLLSAVFLALFHQPKYNFKTIVVFSTIFIVSFLSELIGVQTGLIFGEYNYVSSLGLEIRGTPLIIGLNWLVLVYCPEIIADKITKNTVLNLLLGPSLMVGYDLVLERVAPKLGMWTWTGDVIPIQNYIAWFVFALLFHALIKLTKVEFKNPIAVAVFIIQFMFFVTLVAFFRLSAS